LNAKPLVFSVVSGTLLPSFIVAVHVYESLPSATGAADEPDVVTHTNDELVPETDPVWNVTCTPAAGLIAELPSKALTVAVSGVASDTVVLA
jgi:hypothetical protein